LFVASNADPVAPLRFAPGFCFAVARSNLSGSTQALRPMTFVGSNLSLLTELWL